MIDINDIRAWQTAILLLTFIGIVIWAYSRRRRASFDQAAHLPFDDEALNQKTIDAMQHEDEEKQS